MISFLIKSSVSLLLLFSIYKLFLEQEKMSIFNRFYLLGSLIFSMVIPFISFEAQMEAMKTVNLNAIQISTSAPILEQKTNYLPIFLWSIYGILTAIFAFRFFRNIYVFFEKIKSNPTEKFENAILVLVEEKILPHTFMNYIFINKNDYEERKIEGELFTHELTHVRQKHTLDVLFIETLKTLFWFQPLFIFYKKAIQLNHEFLADEKVVISYKNVPFYQSLLLEKASWNSNFYLASNLNFLVTKKRLIMMTKTTSQSRALLKKLAVLPVLAGLIFISCSENTTNEVPKENAKVTALKEGEEIPQSTLEGTDIFTSVEILPEFPGGLPGFGRFVQENYNFPKDFKGEGNVLISFIVETDGSLSDIKVVRDLGFGTGEEALRILKNSPKWSPGMQDGKPVRVAYNLPIRLRLTK